MKSLEKAKNYTLKIISMRARSEQEIRQKMKEKEYSLDIINETITFLKEYDFLNDQKFTQLWVESRVKLKPSGRWRIKQELRQKGVKEEFIEEELEKISPEKEFDMAIEVARKKTSKVTIKKARLEGFLFRRGFSSQIIRKVVQELPEGCVKQG